MSVSFRSTTSMETAMMKCGVIQDNNMQCNHKPSKLVKTSEIPENIINHNGKAFVLCSAHFNIYKDENKDLDFINEDLKKERKG